MTLTMRQTERKRLLPALWPHLPVFVKGNILTLMFLRYYTSARRGRMCIRERTGEEGGLSVTVIPPPATHGHLEVEAVFHCHIGKGVGPKMWHMGCSESQSLVVKFFPFPIC